MEFFSSVSPKKSANQVIAGCVWVLYRNLSVTKNCIA